MPIEYELETLDGLEEGLKGLYVQDKESGKYTLQINGIDSLKNAKQYEKQARQAAEARLKKIEEEMQAIKDEKEKALLEAQKKSGDVGALEASWKKKIEEAEAKFAANEQRLQGELNKLLVDNVAQSIANEISVSPSLLLPHIKARLQAEINGDTAITRVLDVDGKPSAHSVNDLKNEFMSNKEFAPILKSSNASGGGATADNTTGGSSVKPKMSRAEFDKLSPKEQMSFMTEQGGTLND